MTAVHKQVQQSTKAEWLRAFGGRIHCPCCHQDMVGRYSRGHKRDCPMIKFNAQMTLYEEAPERNEPPEPEYERTLENAVIIEILEIAPSGVHIRTTFSGGGVKERWYQVRDKQNLTLHVRNDAVASQHGKLTGTSRVPGTVITGEQPPSSSCVCHLCTHPLSICPDPDCHRSVEPGATHCPSGHPALPL